RVQQPRLAGDIGEGAVAVVAQEARPDRPRRPCPAADENVKVAVVVIVGLDAVQPAELLAQARLVGDILEGAVSLVAVENNRLRRIPGTGDEIEVAVVIEVVHDRAAAAVEAIDPDEVANIAELADVELAVEETGEGNQVAWIDLMGVLAEGHVRQVEQPANL